MRKLNKKFAMTFSVLLIPFGIAVAQSSSSFGVQNPRVQKLTRAEREKNLKAISSKYPLLMKQKELRPRFSAFPVFSRSTVGIVPLGKNGYAAPKANVTIWANMAYKHGWNNQSYGPFGYYSFHPASPMEYTLLYETPDIQTAARHGVQYKKGHIYGIFLNLSTATSYTSAPEYLYDTDTKTGKTTTETLNASSYLNLVATETAQAVDGTVYGEFYNSDGSGYEWGTVDYSTKSHTVIGKATNIYVALGITKAGQLYGVASDGNLYKIDKTTGTEILVGATGVTLADSQGRFYGQTGEIDHRDDTFYWASLDSNGNGALYDVNLQTGAATKIADNEGDQFYGMYIPEAEAEEGAPDKVNDLAANFTGDNLTGTITFTAPSKTYGGTDLSGNLTYTIKANGQQVATGETTAGATVSAEVSVASGGSYDFEVTTTNSVGESPKAILTKWVGYDIPSTVSNIKAASVNGVVTISWTAPTAGIHGGTISDLTYDVYRILNKDTTKIASDITATTITDDLSGKALSSYTYAVVAKAGTLVGDLASSDAVVSGTSIEPDWVENFDNEEDLDLFTILDANNDGKTWTYYSSRARGTTVSSPSGSDANDDWLFTPPIHLTPDRIYKVSFRLFNASALANRHSTIEVKWGNNNTVEAMTDSIIGTTDPPHSWKEYSKDILAPSDGNYYIGFHANNTTSKIYLLVDSIAVQKGAFAKSPAAATNLKITPARLGRLSADLTFNVPEKSIDGSSLASVDSVHILRDGNYIASLPKANAGAVLSYTDNAVPNDGYHEYEVIAYNDNEAGQTAYAKSYIGNDIPQVPANISLFDNTNNVLAIWDKFSTVGANGGYVNPDDVSVTAFKLIPNFVRDHVGDSITSSEKGVTRMTIPQNPEQTESGDTVQELYRVFTCATNKMGKSEYVVAGPMLIGPSIKLPFKESISTGYPDHGTSVWIEGNDQWYNRDNSPGWYVDYDNSSDNDGGSMVWKSYVSRYYDGSVDYYDLEPGDMSSINMPKVTLAGATSPKLYFDLYATENDSTIFNVKIQTPDGVQHTEKTIDMATLKAGWNPEVVDVSRYTSERYIIVRFWATALSQKSVVGIDNVNIYNQLENNLAVRGFDVPDRATAGRTADIKVYVKNLGANPVNDYSVVLYSGDKVVNTVNVNSNLNLLRTDTVTLHLPVEVTQTENLNVKAQVVYASDLDQSDNTTDTKAIKVIPSNYNTVNDLTATANDDGVDLKWTKPVKLESIQTTDDFESYGAFSTDLGDWTLVDGSEGKKGGFFEGYPYPGQGTSFAFMALNPAAISNDIDILGNNPGFTPHSGKQFAAAPFTTINGNQVDADNWIISPELTGKKQTIKFYAFNLATNYDNNQDVYSENFDVLYSTKSQETSDFVKIESDVADGKNAVTTSGNWKEISVELPEGAKYFAIHHNTPQPGGLVFGIDDISFEKVAPGSNDSIIGYNIYRDGTLIGSVNGNTVTFNDEDEDIVSAVYNVTVLYKSDLGVITESAFSNDATITVVNGIDGITANAEGLYNVYTVDGKAVRLNAKTLNGLSKGLYIINDRKYIIK